MVRHEIVGPSVEQSRSHNNVLHSVHIRPHTLIGRFLLQCAASEHGKEAASPYLRKPNKGVFGIGLLDYVQERFPIDKRKIHVNVVVKLIHKDVDGLSWRKCHLFAVESRRWSNRSPFWWNLEDSSAVPLDVFPNIAEILKRGWRRLVGMIESIAARNLRFWRSFVADHGFTEQFAHLVKLLFCLLELVLQILNLPSQGKRVHFKYSSTDVLDRRHPPVCFLGELAFNRSTHTL